MAAVTARGVASPRAQGDDEHGDGAHEGRTEGRGAREPEGGKAERCEHDDGRDEDAGDAVDGFSQRGAGAEGVLDEGDDAGEGGVGGRADGADLENTVEVDAAGDDGIAAAFADGSRFASEEGFVGMRLAGGNEAIGGNVFAGLSYE